MYGTDEQPFLDAVFDRDADDRPRLVYADFLDDAGETERAELIRVQLALARLGEDDPRRPALLDRQAELLTKNRAAWTAHLAGLVESVDFRRGVPDSASVDAATFLERGDELFRRLRVRRLSLRDAAPVVAKIAASPLLTRVRELDLCNCDLGARGLNVLVKSPFLRHLDALDLGFNGLDDTAVGLLAGSSNFPRLTTLALNDNDTIGDAGVSRLAESPFFAGLTALDLSGNDIGDTGVTALVAGPSAARLRTLRLTSNRIGDAGAAALAGSDLLARTLKAAPELVLRANAIGPAGAAAIAGCPAVARCATLDLSNNYLGDSGVAVLLRSAYLGRVQTLRLGRNQLTDSGLIACAPLFARLFDQLRVLDLSGNRLTRLGISAITALRAHRATQLDVTGNVQSATAGDAPVAVGELLPEMLAGVAEAARLKHRVANPRRLADGD